MFLSVYIVGVSGEVGYELRKLAAGVGERGVEKVGGTVGYMRYKNQRRSYEDGWLQGSRERFRGMTEEKRTSKNKLWFKNTIMKQNKVYVK